MAPSSRDRISVDLRGLKAALIARARATGASPSDLVRTALAASLGEEGGQDHAAPANSEDNVARKIDRIRLSLRMAKPDRDAVLRAARSAGLSPGTFIAGLVADARVLSDGNGPAAHVAALTRSCAELSTLSRNLRYLASLLQQGSSRAAQEYREMLDGLATDIHAHLTLASSVVAEVRPLIRSRAASSESATA